jgi:hypothetical protein
MKKNLLILSVIFTVCIMSCAPAQKITYTFAKVPVSQSTSNISVSIQIFNDLRSQIADNQVYLDAKESDATIENKRQCINAEKRYKIPVKEQITDIFAQHLTHKNYFSKVLINQKDAADYYITANIVSFAGKQSYSYKAAIGAGFGLIGALATANAKAEGFILIELSDITIYDKNDNEIAKVGDFKKEYTGKFPATANCDCIYLNVNEKLREFNDELAQIIWSELKDK